MARAIKYRMQFNDLKERKCVVNIYQDGYTGDVIEIEGAEEPFTTQENNDEDILCAIRTTTGHLNVIDNGNVGELYATYEQDLYLELLRDGVLEFRGYVVAESQSQDWLEPPITLSLNVVSPVETLKGIDLKQSGEMTSVALGSLVSEAISGLGVTVDRIYFPNEWAESAKYQTITAIPFLAKVSRFSFFDLNDGDNEDDEDYTRYDGMSCYDFLEQFCKFFGWTLKEYGKDLYFTRVGCTSYVEIDTSLLTQTSALMSNGVESQAYYMLRNLTTTTSNSVALSALDVNSDSPTIDRMQGYNKFRVVASIKSCGDVVPTLSVSDFARYVWYSSIPTWDKSEMTSVNYMLYYPLTSKLGNSQLHLWMYDPKEFKLEHFTSWQDCYNYYKAKYTSLTDKEIWQQIYYYMGGASFVRVDFFKNQTDFNVENPRANYNYQEAILFDPSGYLSDNVILNSWKGAPFLLAELKSKQTAIYDSGAFSLEATLYGYTFRGHMEIEDNPTQKSLGDSKPMFSFRVGKKYWNGTAWQTTACRFTVDLTDGTTNNTGTQSTIKTNKTLADPYNGLTGYMIPIGSEVLEGDVELRLYTFDVETITLDTFGKVPTRRPIYITGLKMAYYKYDGDSSEDKSENRYLKKVDNIFRSEKDDYQVKIFTNNNNAASYNKLNLCSQDTYTYYSPEKLYNVVTQEVIRPEMMMLGRLKQLFGRITDKLTMDIEQSDELKPWTVITGDKSYWHAASETSWRMCNSKVTLIEQ